MKPIFPIEVDQLSVTYESMPALWELNFSITPGQMVAVVGPNGAGKSTLLCALVNRIRVAGGCCRFWGEEFDQVRSRIAYVPQKDSVDWNFPITVHQLVEMGLYPKMGLFERLGTKQQRLVADALEKVGLSSFAQRQISQLSGGQQQRLFIARALVQQADLYLMDEPFSAVDMATEAHLVKVMKELSQQGKTLVIVHHDLNTVDRYFDSVVLLNVRLIACGGVKEVFNRESIIKTYGRCVSLFNESLE